MREGPDPGITMASGITPEDRRRIREVCDYLRGRSLTDALSDALPPTPSGELIDAIVRYCTLDHVGCLIASSDPREVADYLRAQGLRPRPPIPSSVVNDRLAARHRIPDDRLVRGQLHVQITHAALGADDAPAVEVVHLDPDELSALAMRSERLAQHEHHIAVRLIEPGSRRLENLRRILTRGGELWPDGGGYDSAYGADGATMLHFRTEGRTSMGWPRRLEIIAAGHHTRVLRRHLAAWMAGRRVPAGGRGRRRIAGISAPDADSTDGAAEPVRTTRICLKTW